MNSPAGTIAEWWMSPPDVDAEYPFLAFSLGHNRAEFPAAQAVEEPLRVRVGRVLRTDISGLRTAFRRREPELIA